MNAVRKFLPFAVVVCIVVVIGVSFYALTKRVASSKAGDVIPGLSNPGISPCQNFLMEGQPGVAVMTPQMGNITEQVVRTYVISLHSADSQPITVNAITYFDCGQRTFYYVKLTGSFYPRSSPPGVTLKSASHEYLLFDAKTGALLSIAINN